MTKWVKPLIRLSTYEVETMQKRLSEVVARRTTMEMRLATLDAEREVEVMRSDKDHELAAHMPSYHAGWKVRYAQANQELELVMAEENGIRDELTRAFEDLKKFEHVAEVTKLKQMALQAKLENAAFDEAALRMSQSK